MWSAETLAEAIELGALQCYESLWRKKYGRGLMAASANLYAGTSSGVLKSTDGSGNWSLSSYALYTIFRD